MLATKFYYRDPTAPKPTRPTSVGAVALMERDGRLLLERRSDSARWGLIGGAMELHESIEEAVRREVREETGLEVTRATLFGIYSDPSRIIHYGTGDVLRIFSVVFLVEVADFGAPRCSKESTALRFFDQDELAQMDIVETHRHIVDDYLTKAPLILA